MNIPQHLLDTYDVRSGLRHPQPRHTGLYRLGCFVLAGLLVCLLAAGLSSCTSARPLWRAESVRMERTAPSR